jgi:hypothetical protein
MQQVASYRYLFSLRRMKVALHAYRLAVADG